MTYGYGQLRQPDPRSTSAARALSFRSPGGDQIAERLQVSRTSAGTPHPLPGVIGAESAGVVAVGMMKRGEISLDSLGVGSKLELGEAIAAMAGNTQAGGRAHEIVSKLYDAVFGGPQPLDPAGAGQVLSFFALGIRGELLGS